LSRPLALVSLTAFLLMLGLSVLFPVLPYYIRWLGLSEIEAGWMMSSYALASVVAAPFWGRFSERAGRRPALMIGLVGFSLAFGLFGAASSFWALLAARIVGGLLAAAAMPAIFSYVADVSPPDQRSTALGMVGAAIGLGVLMGPVVGGVLPEFARGFESLADIALRVPFFFASSIGLATAVAVALWVPESLSEAVQADSARRRALLEQHGFGLVKIGAGLWPFLLFMFLIQTGRMGLESTVGFLAADRFDAGPADVGLLLGGIGIVSALVQGGGIRALSKRYSDHQLVLVGTGLQAIGLGGLALSETWTLLAVSGGVLALGNALLLPTGIAEMSRAAESLQGEAQGLRQSAESLGRVVGPLLLLPLYQIAGPAVTYVVAAVVTLGALAVAFTSFRSRLELPPELTAQPAAADS